jgi:hypothetical protein
MATVPCPSVRLAAWAIACATVATLSLLVPAAPGYDAWAWLLWGREIGSLSLDTVAGPAWKPLPVLVTTLLAPAGGLAPELWLVVARAGAIAAVVLAGVVAWRLSRGSRVAAGVAAGGVLLTGGFVRHAAVGDAEPLLVALMLGAVERALAGRHRQALALGALAALVRPEVWPFLALYGIWRWREERDSRLLLAAVAVVIPAAWVVPELLSSGELFRSADRARVPNPGQPATADVPLLATLAAAAGVLFLPTALAALAARRAAAVLALAGAAWIGIVALMSQAGFSGEPRYLLPGAALVAVGGAAGLVRVRRLLPVALAAVAVFGAIRAADLADLGPRLDHQHQLAADLERAIDAAGGRDAILACGRPAVGRYRGTLLAYHLDVPKRTVLADGEPGAVTFRSRLTPGAAAAPAPRGRLVAANARWRVYSFGRSCLSDTTGAKRSPCSSTRARTCSLSKTRRSGSPASLHSATSSQVIGVETVGRSFARSE